MKQLIEMCSIITPNRIKDLELFDRNLLSKKGDKLNRLYTGIAKGQFKNDEDAAKSLYQTGPLDGKYIKLKSKLKRRLVNNCFFLDFNTPAFSSFHQAKLACHKNLALCNILTVYAARESAIKIAKQNLNTAIKYTFNDVAIGCARILKEYCTLKGDLKGYEHYSALHEYHEMAWLADMKAESYYQHLLIHYANSVAIKNELSDKAEQFFTAIEPLSQQYNSYLLHYYMYRIEALIYQLKGDYKAGLNVYERLEHFLNSNNHFRQDKTIANVNMSKLACNLHLNDFKKGAKAAEICLQSFPKGHINWFVFNEPFYLLAVRTGNYIEAKTIFNAVVFHHRYKDYVPARNKEKWKIYEAYLNFIQETGKITTEELKQFRNKRFSISKFLNEVPIFSKDKRGYNIAILIIHILFLLNKEDYNPIIDRIDALRIYYQRHLKREEDIRSKLFIKMLLVMEKQSFDYVKTKEKSQKYFDEIRSRQFQYEGTPIDAEIIPYETLWQMVLDVLKGQKGS